MIIGLDESGTHASRYLVIGALFFPDPTATHQDLCAVKENNAYWNTDQRKKARYKEVHYAKVRTKKDAEVCCEWIDVFARHKCWYRCIVVDWTDWDGRHFGEPFETDALKKRRAYKKWTEMLLHPEVKGFRLAWLKLDELTAVQKYEVIEGLKERFTRSYEGVSPRISEFLTVSSWKDGNQDVQLCDLLTGCIYNSLVTPTGKKSRRKTEVRKYLFEVLKDFGVESHEPNYWRGYAKNSLSRHFPKFSIWFWRPGE